MFLWDNRKAVDWQTCLTAWSMVLVALFTNLNIASGVGFVLVSLKFIHMSMNVEVVRSVERADIKRSPTRRTAEEFAILDQQGHKIMVLHLEGYLFWGTVDKIVHTFDEIIDGADHDPSIVYVNLRDVTGLELSVLNVFRKLHRLAKKVDVKLVVCGFFDGQFGPQLDPLLRSLPFADNTDLVELLRESEDKIIEESSQLTIAFQPPDVPDPTDLKMRRSVVKEHLMMSVSGQTSSALAIRWELVNGSFQVGQGYVSDWRAQLLVKHIVATDCVVRTFFTESSKHSASVGAGEYISPVATSCSEPEPLSTQTDILVEAWRSQKTVVVLDTSLMSLGTFPRKAIAEEFQIKHSMFVPTPDGVYEFSGIEAGPWLQELIIKFPGIGVLTLPQLPDAILASGCEAHMAGLFAVPDVIAQSKRQSIDSRIVLKKCEASTVLSQSFTWNLLLSILTIGEIRHVKQGETPLKEEPDGIADEIVIVLTGRFTTYVTHKHAIDERPLLRLMSGPGALVGVDDVWACRPRDEMIKCSSEEGQVVALSRKAVHSLEMCESVFVGPAESLEFIEYQKRETALNLIAVENATEMA
jgi:anti-anti-sigma regulatory factor